MYDDGKILPIGSALMIEADIERLDENRRLR